MDKTIRYALYVLIIAICVVSIGVAVYAQFFQKDKESKYSNNINTLEDHNIITEQDIKHSFLDLFTNEFYSNYDDTKIKKIDNTKDIVYTAYSKTETIEGKYSIDLNIPIINISGNVTNEYNSTTQRVFADKINSIMQNATEYTIYNLDYISYVNNNILSVAIKATIKEGNNPQRIIVQTYNYDMEKDQDIKLSDILTLREIENSIVDNKIKETIEKASKDAEKMAESGYSVYKRNLNSNIYRINNIQTFMQGPNGELYIIFAYGNNNYTSEMDIIEI